MVSTDELIIFSDHLFLFCFTRFWLCLPPGAESRKGAKWVCDKASPCGVTARAIYSSVCTVRGHNPGKQLNWPFPLLVAPLPRNCLTAKPLGPQRTMLGVVQLRLGGESGNGEGQWLFWEYLVNIRRKRLSYCYCSFDQVLRTSELGNVYTRSDTRRCSDLVSLTSDPITP